MISSHITGAAISICIAAPAAWMIFDRSPPVVIHHMAAVTPEVKPGGQLIVSIDQTRKRVCHTESSVVIYDGASVSIKYEAIARAAFGPPETSVKRVAYQIPTSAFPGEATWQLTLVWECNPIHKYLWPIVEVFPPVHFIIEDPRDEFE